MGVVHPPFTERPKVMLRSGVALEFTEDSQGEVQTIDEYLKLAPSP